MAIERLRAGDRVLSRDEHEVGGEVGAKAVEETFVRHGEIWELRLGGRTVLVTPEHPVFVRDRGWTPAGEVVAGDELATLSGEWRAVESNRSTGGTATVDNLRVADWHTDFVGDDDWPFALWVHNAYSTPLTPSRRGWTGTVRSAFNDALVGVGITSSTDRQRILRQIRDNFSDYAKVRISRTTRERSFWRRWDGIDADEIGRYGTIGPRSAEYSHLALAVRRDWNALTKQSRLRIRSGGLVVEGIAAPKVDVDGARLPGDGWQLFVPYLKDLIR